MTTWLGFDVGTQGVKAVLLARARGVVARASAPLATLPGLPAGHSEQHPADWRDALCAATGRLAAAAPEAVRDVAGIAVSGQQHGLVALDAADRVLRPAMLWNDVRAAAECRAIVAAAGGREATFARLGFANLPPGFTAGKVRWLHDHEPETFARLARVLLPHDWIDHWLTGRACTDAGDASGTGVFDSRARRFDPTFAELVAPGLAAALPELVAPGTVIGALRDAAAVALGLRPGIPVAVGSGDNMMAAVGAGAITPGVVCLSLGTSGTVFAHADHPVVDPDGEIAAFCGATGGWLPLGCTMNATVATEAARHWFGMSLDQLEHAVEGVPAGSEGVVCLPFLTGERSPDLPAATASLHGLTPRTTTPAHAARALMEGATYALCRLLDRLRALGVDDREIRLTGGGSNSAVWRGIVAAAAERPIAVGVDPDAAAVGAAVVAAWATRRASGEPDLDVATCRADFALDAALRRESPSAGAVAAHAAARARWNRTLEAMLPLLRDEPRPR